MKVGVLRFPGSNCDHDVGDFVKAKGYKLSYLWHLDFFEEKEFDALILPGGFSYGDYLRSGALAARSPAIQSLKKFSERGGPVLGICNGFQILTEAGLLPGSLVRNSNLSFIDAWVDLRVENSSPVLTHKISPQIRLPIAHGDGRFYAPEKELQEIEDQGLVWLRYEKNPNGSLNDIAGVKSKHGNVMALMPHPERAIYPWMGGSDGWGFL